MQKSKETRMLILFHFIYIDKHNKYLLGLLHDKTVVAFYGDPAIDARIAKDTNYVLPYTTAIKEL